MHPAHINIDSNKTEFRKPFQKLFSFNRSFGIALILLICVPRFVLVLQANLSGSYRYIAVVMVISALLPIVLLSAKGRAEAGIIKPAKTAWLIPGFLAGALLALVVGLLGTWLYGYTDSNWYHYIGRSYQLPPGLSGDDKLVYFAITAITGMIFSPIGEELFFRGIVHAAIAKTDGHRRASNIDSLAFALTHLAHFGIIVIDGRWSFLLLPALIWLVAMFVASKVFYYTRLKTGSILGAVLSHAGFNLGMTYCIFYL